MLLHTAPSKTSLLVIYRCLEACQALVGELEAQQSNDDGHKSEVKEIKK